MNRVEDWRGGVGRSLCSPLSRPFVSSVIPSRPCHVSSPRLVERSMQISRTALFCLPTFAVEMSLVFKHDDDFDQLIRQLPRQEPLKRICQLRDSTKVSLPSSS